MNATIEQSPIFIKGLLFSWFPIFFIFATIVVNMFRAFAPNKAMGLGVVAAGISEGLLCFGIVAAIGCQFYGAFLLVRTFSSSQFLSRLVVVLSIAGSATLCIAIATGLVWMRSRS
jgi:hypothetical protein